MNNIYPSPINIAFLIYITKIYIYLNFDPSMSIIHLKDMNFCMPTSCTMATYELLSEKQKGKRKVITSQSFIKM